jgi:hypothetical protein
LNSAALYLLFVCSLRSLLRDWRSGGAGAKTLARSRGDTPAQITCEILASLMWLVAQSCGD